MPRPLTADDIIRLAASLPTEERVRLLRLIALPQGTDAQVYQSVPPSRDEFSADEEPLAWTRRDGRALGKVARFGYWANWGEVPPEQLNVIPPGALILQRKTGAAFSGDA